MVLPSDWSYLKEPTLKTEFDAYANDNDLFLTNFAIAWKKVTEKGKESVLQQCNKVTCTIDGDKITCPVQASSDGNTKRYTGHHKVKHGSRAGESQNSGTLNSGSDWYQRPTELTFKKDNCDSEPPSSGSCELVGGVGVRAKFQCGDWTGQCCDDHRGCQLLENIKKEWNEGGGKDGTCSMPPLPQM